MATKRPKEDCPESAETPSFEEALGTLEKIVHELEEGQLGLNEALQRYEEGVKLLRRCYNLLEGAERRIELLSGLDPEGNPVTQPFDDQSTLSLDEKRQRRGQNRTANAPDPDSGESGCTPETPGIDMSGGVG